MSRKVALAACLCVCLALVPEVAQAQPGADRAGSGGKPELLPGAPGVGDPYFPLDGNGGYDVRHYLLDLAYDPATDVLTGTATITARATQNLSTFNLDLEGLTVRSIEVNGRSATWSREGGELTVIPQRGLRNRTRFTAVVTYDGIPETLGDPSLGASGFFHTDDGALVVGEPDVAATWFPVNDHPIDKAAYTFEIAAPEGLEVVANGVLQRSRTRQGWTTWTWNAKEPMASYLAMMAVGEFDVRAYREDGLRFWDALDPDLFDPIAPRTGDQFALSQVGDLSYKRLARTISVPATGAQLSFWITRDTEPNWDFAFVEAHTVGQDDWTTLPDLNGHTGQDTGFSCPFWLSLHPFLEHYQTDNGDGTCSPGGSSGAWWAASGASDGYELWAVDLSAYAGTDVDVSISYASDDIVQLTGAFVDDVTVSSGSGTTSFEDDGDTLDGWAVPGAPAGSSPNPNDWIVGSADDAPPTLGEIAEGSFARQGEIIDFLSDTFGRYPFSAAGGIVDDLDDLGFALENQTRPIYGKGFFGDSVSGDSVVVHELAHQWYGDSLAVEEWQHIWLNEGFATYAEWLWSEREGLGTAQENFDFFYSVFPPEDPFWAVTIGDPGAADLFNFAVYARGAMTLHQLRLAVGDDDFFRILRRWASSQAGGNVNTTEFIDLAERISGQQLDELFQTWLFTPGRPDIPESAAARTAAGPPAPDLRHAPPAARSLVERLGQEASFVPE
jgi:Peptidase family M1 domain/Peptidase M1 N-terminal domain